MDAPSLPSDNTTGAKAMATDIQNAVLLVSESGLLPHQAIAVLASDGVTVKVDQLSNALTPLVRESARQWRKVEQERAEYIDKDSEKIPAVLVEKNPGVWNMFKRLGDKLSYFQRRVVDEVKRQESCAGKLDGSMQESLGLIQNKSSWLTRYEELVRYNGEFGNCNVPLAYETNPQLGRWVCEQRTSFRAKVLSESYIAKLNEIGFAWEFKKERADGIWNKRYNELVQYKRDFGSCNVPYSSKSNPQLGHWVHNQRKFYKNKTISENQIAKLNEIEFAWEVKQNWETRYIELLQYKSEFGDCRVPATYPAKPQLGSWVRKQREQFRRNLLANDKITILNNIGFNWEVNKDTWQTRYNELIEYKQQFGHVQVPRGYASNPQLGKWVDNQRVQWKNKTLSKERIAKLNHIGFDWEIRIKKDSWMTEYSGLVPTSYLAFRDKAKKAKAAAAKRESTLR